MDAKKLLKKMKKKVKKVPLTKEYHDQARRDAIKQKKQQKADAVAQKKRKISQDDSDGDSAGSANNGHVQMEVSNMADKIDGQNVHVSADYDQHESSISRARAAFEWLIAPMTASEFYGKYFEKRAFVISHHNKEYYQKVFTSRDMDNILHRGDVYFSKNIDVTSYVDGQRETHNPDGKALAAQVWSMYQDGCSVRLLNPQSYIDEVHRLCYTLQEEFGSFVGANVYLTPAGTQGFAPHWDDIDAFVLQLEGKKHWKVYAPRVPEEELPLDSSKNLERDEVGELILETVLNSGDILYMPRGFIHEARSCPDAHSLHITLSSNQHNTWSDLFKIMLPGALELATAEDVEFRRTLPRDYLHIMGVMNSDSEDKGRKKFLEMAGKLFDKLAAIAPVDAAVDQMAKNYLHDSLPPALTQRETKMAAHTKAIFANGSAPDVELDLDSMVRLVRKTACRIVSEGESFNMYYITDNTKVYREFEEPFSMEVTATEATVIEQLTNAYPRFIRVSEFDHDGEADDKIDLAITLYHKGLLLAK